MKAKGLALSGAVFKVRGGVHRAFGGAQSRLAIREGSAAAVAICVAKPSVLRRLTAVRRLTLAEDGATRALNVSDSLDG